jgi:hypothetical protein
LLGSGSAAAVLLLLLVGLMAETLTAVLGALDGAGRGMLLF